MTVIIVLHFVKRFVWDCSVFNQYSYYRDFLCSGTESRLCDFHRHLWVHYINTKKITVWCMSSILIHMNYFLFIQYEIQKTTGSLLVIVYRNLQSIDSRLNWIDPSKNIFPPNPERGYRTKFKILLEGVFSDNIE